MGLFRGGCFMGVTKGDTRSSDYSSCISTIKGLFSGVRILWVRAFWGVYEGFVFMGAPL